MNESRDEQVAHVLGAGIESLDLPDEQHLIADTMYKAASSFLRDYWSDSETGGAMYPQGSMRLGTVTRLIHRKDEYDLDMVCRHDVDKEDVTKEDLKADIGFALEQFIKSHPELGLIPEDEGRRCWTFSHESLPFHMDVLPAIPDPKSGPNGILVTDTEAFRWHRSAPIAYADWFLDLQREEWEAGARVLAERKQMDVERLPRHAFKTALQRTVQALKRHRDIYFAKDLKRRPASIIITTLAAQSYEPVGSLFDVLRHVVERMPTLVARTASGHEIPNPVQPRENFADRWKGHPGRSRAFFEWMAQAQRDFGALETIHGIPDLLAKTATILGNGPAAAAQRALGNGLRQARLAGELTMAPVAGTLVRRGKGPVVHQHDFHGDH
jgi:hypothetical protein